MIIPRQAPTMRAPDDEAPASPEDVGVVAKLPEGEEACRANEIAAADAPPPSFLQKLGLITNGRPGRRAPPRVPWQSSRTSGIGAFLGIAAVSLIQRELGVPAVTGAFAASAVLLYDACESPLSQPRNLIGGHALSAVIGVSVYKVLGHTPWLANAVAVSLAIVAMDLTRTLHPPGGATALIACIGPEKITDLGYWYVLYPVILGAATLLAVALVANNLDARRQYPLWWY